MSLRHQIGRRVAQARKQSGLTIVALATRAGWSPTSIWSIEKGRIAVRVEAIYDIAEALGVPPTELLP